MMLKEFTIPASSVLNTKYKKDKKREQICIVCLWLQNRNG